MELLNITHQAASTLIPNQMQGYNSSSDQIGADMPPFVSFNPWTGFERMWKSVVGYPTGSFEFHAGKTPMSTFTETACAILSYYIVIFGGRELMRNRPALKLNNLFIIHNFYLTAISAGLLVLFGQELLPRLWKSGLYDGICGGTGWSQNLLVLYYLNYLTKYLELLDTVFLVLRKKPLTFLHTYHHGATALLCYTQLVGKTPVSWVPITLNLGVHVVMYWYYFQSARGIRIWWKQFITVFQITQFVLDLGFIYYATWNFYASNFMPSLPHSGPCGHDGQGVAAAMGCAILTSYLFLFVGFYISTYRHSSNKLVAKKAVRRASMTEVPTIAESTAMTTGVVRSVGHTIAEPVGMGKRNQVLAD